MNHFTKIQENLGTFDGVLLTCAENRLYASGFASHGGDGVAFVTKNSVYYFTDFRYIEAVEQQVEGAAIAMCDRQTPYHTLISQVIQREKLNLVGVDESYMTVTEKRHYAQKLTCEFGDCSPLLSKLRQTKTPWEVAQMVTAQGIAERALLEVYNDIQVGVSERLIAARLEYFMGIYGSEKPSFDTIAVAGKKSAMPHGVPGSETLAPGDFLTMDFGATYNGYHSDMTRTVAVGHVTDQMAEVYETVLAAQLAGIATAKAGATGASVHQAAAEVIASAGYGDYFGHGFGHGIGVEIHEAPNASPANTAPLPNGAVISAEPGIYLPGKFGVRIEDMLYLGEDGTVNLTKAEKKLQVFGDER